MRILITNDDGIESSVLPKFAEWATKFGDVTVVAPKFEQSGKSQAIDFRRHSEVKKVDHGVDCDAYYMDSTPADCVRFAVLGLHRQYDIVFSYPALVVLLKVLKTRVCICDQLLHFLFVHYS